MQFIRWLGIAEDHYEWSVEELRAVHFDLIGKCVSWELCYVSLEVEDVQAYGMMQRKKMQKRVLIKHARTTEE